jgi:hypothetical protein
MQYKEILSNSFYKASIILLQKVDKDPTRNENYRLIFLMNKGTKTLNAMLTNLLVH